MGNCIRKQHWREYEHANSFHDKSGNSKGEGLEKSNILLGEPKGTDRVTVKVSKRQLQQLLKQADVEGLSSQELLSRLMMNVGDLSESEAHQRSSWIPSLQSIPE